MKKIIFVFCLMMMLLTGLKVSALTYTTSEDNADTYEYINKEELEEGKLIRSDLNIIAPTDNYYINNIYYDSNIYIVVGYIIVDGVTGYASYPFVSYYENYSLVFNKIFNSQGIGEFKEVIFIDDYIFISGYIEQNQISKPYLVKLDTKGRVYKSIVLECDKNTSACSMYNDFGEIYIIGVTHASYIKDIKLNNTYNRVFLLVLDYNFEVKRCELIGNDRNNEIYDVIYDDYNFYIYGQTGGDGDIAVSSDYQKVVYSYDIFGEFIYSSRVNNSYIGYNGIVLHKKNIYFLNKPYEEQFINVYSGDYEELKKKGSITFNNNDDIKNVFYKMIGDTLIISQVISLGDRDIIRISYVKEKTVESVDIDLYDICSIKNVYCNSDKILFFGNMLKENKYRSFAAEVSLLQIKNNKVYINNVEVFAEKPEIEANKYGNYKVDVLYQHNGIKLYVKENIYKELQCNLINKGIFDLGVSIEANGEMFLNGEKIDDGYIFYKEGEYLLEIKGEKVETLYLIKVENLSKEVNEIKGNIINEEFKEPEKMSKDEILYSSTLYENSIDKRIIIFSFLMIMIIFGFVLGFILPNKKGGKKNA